MHHGVSVFAACDLMEIMELEYRCIGWGSWTPFSVVSLLLNLLYRSSKVIVHDEKIVHYFEYC